MFDFARCFESQRSWSSTPFNLNQFPWRGIRASAVASLVLGLGVATMHAQSPSFVVNSNQDNGAGATDCPPNSTAAGAGTCTLRDALAAAGSAGAGNITFDGSVFAATNTAAQNTITLTNGVLLIPTNTSITGLVTSNGANQTNQVTVNGDSRSTVFVLLAASTASIANLNIEFGNDNGGFTCSVCNNATINGGGIYNGGTLTVTNSTFYGNSAGPGSVGGGGIYSVGTLMVINSAFYNNSAGLGYYTGQTPAGGGIYSNYGTLTVINSTFTGNSVGQYGGGGGIMNWCGTSTVTNSTFIGNSVGLNGGGGGIYNNVGAAGPCNNNSGTLTLANSIVSGNWFWIGTATTPDTYDDLDDTTGSTTFTAAVGNDGGNLLGNYNVQTAAAPGPSISLDPLGNYGGSTQTMIPLPGSPAICAGTASPAGGLTLPTTDQRGDPRTNTTYPGYSAGTACVDSGAVQTHYALSITDPTPIDPATEIFVNAAFQASTTLEESGVPFGSTLTPPATVPSVTVPLTLTGNGQLTDSTSSPGPGVTDYVVTINAPGTDDVLTASLALNAALSTPLTITQASASFTVNALTPTVIWPQAGAITYGQQLSSSSLTGGSANYGGATVSGTFAWAAPTTSPSAGSQLENVIFTPTGATGYAPVTGSVAVIVNQAPTTTALTLSSTSVSPGQTLTLTATVKSPDGSPTGTVSFYDNGSLLNAATLSAGVATYSVSSLAPGVNHTITANYSGDQNFLTSSSTATTTVNVVSLDFTINIMGATSKTVQPGATVTFQVQVSPTSGSYPGPVAISLTGLPTGTTPTVSPQSIAANSGSQNITVTIPMPGTMAARRTTSPSPNGRKYEPLALALLLFFGIGGLRKQRRILGRLLCVTVLLVGGVAASLLSGCESVHFAPTPPATYAVNVTATSGTLQHTATYTINLQP
ncbi:MAG: Ig-like domain-containing protein [Terracidiphilus sp.]